MNIYKITSVLPDKRQYVEWYDAPLASAIVAYRADIKTEGLPMENLTVRIQEHSAALVPVDGEYIYDLATDTYGI